MTRFALVFAFITASAVGCARHAPEYRGRIRVQSAQLVAVNPDVKTVADADKPLFFSRGFFWLFHDGGWWRAPLVTSEVWVKVDDPPIPVKQILNPYAFTNYRDDETRTAARETTAAPIELQRELAKPTKEDHRTEAEGDQPDASKSDRSSDPSEPGATTDLPSLAPSK